MKNNYRFQYKHSPKNLGCDPSLLLSKYSMLVSFSIDSKEKKERKEIEKGLKYSLCCPFVTVRVDQY